ncbi:MAG: phytoene desaturase family protein [Finegoldia sp.]|nr:phytoene desaturase family protein [Finegoldia sp.]
MAKKKVSVIGAGIGGLSAAIDLILNGYEVEIYEQTDQPGGKMHKLSFDGHSFDVGPTLVMMPKAYEDVFRNAGKDPADYISFIKVDPMYDVYFSEDYRKYSVNSDLKDLMKIVEGMGEESAKGFLRYLSDIYERYMVALKYFIRRPFRNKRDIYKPKMLVQAMRLKTFDSAKNMMAKYIPNKDMQEMLSFQTLYIGVSPSNGPSLYNIIPMIELLYGVWSLKGGMHAMAEAMERLFLELGGKIYYKAKVDQIVSKDKKVEGISVDGNFIKSDIVISNADFPYTMAELIKDESIRGKYTKKKIDSMDYSCSCLVFYWAIDGVFENLADHTFIVSKDLDKNLEEIFSGKLIEDPSVYLSIPSNMDKSMAPEGKSSFYLLIPVPELGIADYEYDEKTIAYYRQKAIDHLRHLPGLENIEELILREEYFSPLDFRNEFSAYRGATFGLQPTLRQSNHWRPQSKSHECEGLYFTGSSTHPGAGVPIAIEGGKICAKEVMKDYY